MTVFVSSHVFVYNASSCLASVFFVIILVLMIMSLTNTCTLDDIYSCCCTPIKDGNCCVFSDVMVEFMMSHMMKKLPVELFVQSVSIIHRLLCYQKRNSVRLPYNWKELWAALIALAKFLVTNEAYLAKKMNIFQLAHQVFFSRHFSPVNGLVLEVIYSSSIE